MSTPQPIPSRLIQRSTPSPAPPPFIASSSRPPTASSTDPPTPRPSQLPFPSGSSPSATTTTTTTDQQSTEDGLSTTPNANNTELVERDKPFLPFFTLVQDASTASHFHPTVRYVFSDDEFDPVAILSSKGQQQLQQQPPPHGSGEPSGPNSLSNSGNAVTPGGNSGSGSQADVDSGSGQFGKLPGKGRAPERVILVDVAADGEGILSAHSLSPEWQVNGVSVSKAPTWMSDDTASANTVGEGGLMLTIEGVGRKGKPAATAGLGIDKRGTEGLEELVALYQERLERLQGVVEWAEGRRAVDGDATGDPVDTTGT